MLGGGWTKIPSLEYKFIALTMLLPDGSEVTTSHGYQFVRRLSTLLESHGDLGALIGRIIFKHTASAPVGLNHARDQVCECHLKIAVSFGDRHRIDLPIPQQAVLGIEMTICPSAMEPARSLKRRIVFLSQRGKLFSSKP